MHLMKIFSTLTILALIAAATVAGCTAPSAQETTTAQAPAPDERYRVVTVDANSLGAGAPADTVEAYVKAMQKAAVPRPPADMKVPDKARVVMQTNRGPITLELDAQAAPLHVKSFVYLAQKGFFDGTIFHRHADLLGGGKGYIIQGGDPLTKDASAMKKDLAGLGGPGYQIPRERNALTHQKLVIAAARASDPDSAGSQFYITQDAVPFLDDGDGYTVFGKVVDGEEAALKLQKGDTLQSIKVEDAPK